MRSAFVFCFLLTAYQLCACTCSFPSSIEKIDELISESEIIFIGIAGEEKKSNEVSLYPFGSYYQFKTNQLFKGSLKWEVVVMQSGSSCDQQLNPGRKYLIFAERGSVNRVRTGGCRIFVVHPKIDLINTMLERLKTKHYFSMVWHSQLPLLRVDLEM